MKPQWTTNSILNNKLMAFFGLPLIFVILAYVIIYFIAEPIITPVSSVFDMITGDTIPDFSQAQNTNDILEISKIANQAGTISSADITLPKYGDVYATLTIDGAGVNTSVYYGDDNAILRKGVGQYTGSMLPGFGSTTLLGGHVNTYFKGLKNVKVGDVININTTYGAYEYTVTNLKVVDYQDKTAYDLAAAYDNLILYTCYPFGTLGFTAQRYFVYAELTSGPKVKYTTDK